ncbi:MAG: DUF692 domain-containing protein [Proteobacteria bacterium]|nr:DUF692 domain-containing protein [Pseudomonadota bacterium]
MSSRLHIAAADPIPAQAGIGLRAGHYADFGLAPQRVAWIEVHPENYMCAGGPQHRVLGAARACCPVSFHGVGLSLGGAARPDKAHLARLAELIRRYEPSLFSEHLAWSIEDGRFLNDLLPLPYTKEALERLVSHVDEIQDYLGRHMLIENPSLYLSFEGNETDEPALLTELVRRTGCGLLLDVNNVFVSATNCGFDPRGYLARYPLAAIEEIHLAGYRAEIDADGVEVLIDTHNDLISDPVWALYRHVINQTGPRPTLIEWDQDLPAWDVLLGEAARADDIMRTEVLHAAE